MICSILFSSREWIVLSLVLWRVQFFVADFLLVCIRFSS